MTKALHDTCILGVIMTQFSLKKDLKVHSQCAEGAVVKELTHSYSKQTFSPIAYKDIPRQEHVKIMSALMLLKGERDSTMKGYCCANTST